MNANDVTGPCATVQYVLTMLTCGRSKDGIPTPRKKTIGRNAKLRTVRFGSVIGKPKPNHPTVFQRHLPTTWFQPSWSGVVNTESFLHQPRPLCCKPP